MYVIAGCDFHKYAEKTLLPKQLDLSSIARTVDILELPSTVI